MIHSAKKGLDAGKKRRSAKSDLASIDSSLRSVPPQCVPWWFPVWYRTTLRIVNVTCFGNKFLKNKKSCYANKQTVQSSKSVLLPEVSYSARKTKTDV